MPRVAWVMVNHNGGQELLETLRSLATDLSTDDLVLLVDNGSDDGSGEEAERLGLPLKRFVTGENHPFSTAVNLGILEALALGTEFIGLLNPDVRIRPDMTRTLLDYQAQSGGRTVVSPVMENAEGRIWYAGGAIYWPFATMTHRCIGRSHGSCCVRGGTTGYLTGCCFIAPAATWETVGLLDEEFVFYGEDADWSWRARQAGWRLAVVPDARLVHNVSSSSGGGRTEMKMLYRTVATRRFFLKHSSGILHSMQRVGRPLADAAYALFLLLRGEHRALAMFRRALTLDANQRMPWPPSRSTIDNS